MRIRIHDCEGKEEMLTGAHEVIPFAGVFVSPLVRKPWDGLVNYRGRILPVKGPVPHLWNTAGSYDERPWLLILGDHARVIHGLPVVLESVETRSDLEGEVLALEKSSRSA
ncbi:MAG: hypothetical protein HUU37_03450 [Bdellovibrionales bacterium]|nr:hypothetical protein [Bdellovibrionales bacterium]